jgi:hypothetical protein
MKDTRLSLVMNKALWTKSVALIVANSGATFYPPLQFVENRQF